MSPAAGRITVAELADEYRESRVGQVSVRAWESDENTLRVHIVPAFRHLSISSVSSVQIERLTHVAVSRSVRTAARVRTTLRCLFRYAVRTRRLAKSPAEDVPLPRPDSRPRKVVEIHPLPVDVLVSVLDAQREHASRYADITLVLALTGLGGEAVHSTVGPDQCADRAGHDQEWAVPSRSSLCSGAPGHREVGRGPRSGRPAVPGT